MLIINYLHICLFLYIFTPIDFFQKMHVDEKFRIQYLQKNLNIYTFVTTK